MFVTVVYIHPVPKANVNVAASEIFDVTQRLDSISPDAPKFILGEFNHRLLNKTLLTYFQYVTCKTHMNKTIDLCYGTVRSAYTSAAKPPLGD